MSILIIGKRTKKVRFPNHPNLGKKQRFLKRLTLLGVHPRYSGKTKTIYVNGGPGGGLKMDIEKAGLNLTIQQSYHSSYTRPTNHGNYISKKDYEGLLRKEKF